jgi:putative aldouronate transport system substrate-binding protein
MRKKAIAASLLTFSLLLSGCTENNQANKKDNDGKDSKDPKIELSWFVYSADANALLPSENDDFVKKAIEDKFNVDLKIESLPLGPDRTNQLNARIASGDAPDMFVTTGLDSQAYATDGVLADMTKYVNDDKMPNYMNWLKEKELERYAINDSFVRAPLPFNRKIYRSYFIRKDWLDKLKLDVPKSHDELLEVMEAFTKKDPDGNGKKDTYGFSAAGNGSSISFDFPAWVNNGLPGVFFLEDGKKFVDVQTDPRVEQVVDEVVAMQKAKIVDPDWFLNQGTQHMDKAVQGKVGIIMDPTGRFGLEGDQNSGLNRSKAINPKAEWVAFNPFSGVDGVWTEQLPDLPFVFAKTTADKNPDKLERSAEILDWLASEEGFLLTHYGIEGKHYKKDGKTVTLDPEASNKDIASKGNFLDIYDFFTPDDATVLGLEVIDPRYTDNDREMLKKITSYPLVPSIGTNVAPPKGINLGDLRGKMKEYHAKMVMEEKSGKNWPKYREDLMTTYKGNEIFNAYQEQIDKSQSK